MANDTNLYAEIFMLMKTAEQGILSGQLTETQHTMASSFHILGNAILDLNARLLAQSEFATDKPVASGIIMESE